MERLTSHCGAINDGNTYYPKSNIATGNVFQQILNTLGKYENTELTPEEIDQLKANQPVKGEWYQEIGEVHSTGKYRNCSICNKSVFIPYFSKQGIERIDFDYCPNCGADMRGEENE